ncbi:patatin-like phospholipase family protein [Rubrivivax rivuli]|uniref:Patatin family protein n=1 Tax=Rubrivivax rivuli TaxID=1862385 RepID=A0A437RKU0_9BURK|nr:patatin-like phospholipase family protein [Rubrivivax rivuli]RVU47374.1 patatin family protein [Rubrivivax rivuli]
MPVTRPRIGLALAGGGPLGAIYEIGALCALAEALPGLDFTALDGYVGVSAGSFIAAGLANGLTPRQLCTSFVENEGPATDLIRPGLFFRPAWQEYAQRLLAAPRLAGQAAWDVTVRGRTLLAAAERLGRVLPAGLFSNAALQAQLAQVFSAPGRSNDFRQLQRERGRRLVLVATDLDSGEAAPFGLPGWDHVPISQAVAASAALPGLFPPEPINGRWYVDGALKKTLHARVLLDEGLDLLLCLNPLVPFDARGASSREAPRHRVLGGASERIPQLVAGGLPLVLSQTFRSLIHSRLELGMKGYEASHPGTDILLFEPDHADPEMFLANTFGYSQRRVLAEHAYQHTRADLRSRRSELRATLSAQGLVLDEAVLDDAQRRLLRRRIGRRPAALPASRTEAGRALQRLDEVLNDLERALAAR